jgi:glycosyltransferase involved in cell wall biosynthesis
MKLYRPAAEERPPAETRRDDRIGVVIPVYNRRTILQDTLPYVVDQTLPPAHLVIVDDGSTDGTPAAVEAWLARRRPRCPWKVIRTRHRTAAAARNVGLAEVKSLPLVAFLDSDDHWPLDFLERCAATLAAHPRSVAAVADRRFIDAFGEQVDEDDCRHLVRDPVSWFFHHGAGVASCTVLRTQAVLDARGWDETYDSAEDAVLFCEAALAGEWVHVPGPPVEFFLGAARARREEHNLSQRYVDAHLGWALAFERILERVVAVRPQAPRGELHKALAMRWYWAGKQLFALGRADEARDAFRRALSWQPTMFRAWRRLATSGGPWWGKHRGAPRGDGDAKRQAG